ncbi:hypothetical protein [Candidatus Pseudomonas adelgestsugas]
MPTLKIDILNKLSLHARALAQFVVVAKAVPLPDQCLVHPGIHG